MSVGVLPFDATLIPAVAHFLHHTPLWHYADVFHQLRFLAALNWAIIRTHKVILCHLMYSSLLLVCNYSSTRLSSTHISHLLLLVYLSGTYAHALLCSACLLAVQVVVERGRAHSELSRDKVAIGIVVRAQQPSCTS